jgi:AICAR transformylase/IMP cyclohydrolase PurH/REP element-mobilizing transposase RayT
MADGKIKRALIAVYDKTGVAEFAKALVEEFGVEIISTGGTARHLKAAGIPVTMVEQVTGFPEMLDGRVKTLHPKIHAAILADRDNPEHMRQLAEQGIQPIDMVVVNLYPFEKTIAKPGCTLAEAIEMIDIGGPCLLRAAAKNHKHVLAVPYAGEQEYHGLLRMMRGEKDVRSLEEERRQAAFHVFSTTAEYDSLVWTWLGGSEQEGSPTFFAKWFFREAFLRYGENPHQTASMLLLWNDAIRPSLISDVIRPEGEYEHVAIGRLSYNNFVDADAAFGLCAELTRAVAGGAKLWHRLLVGAGTESVRHSLPPISQQLKTRRNLPHIQRPGATYFLTFRKHAGQFSPEQRDIVMECCIYPDGGKVCLHAAVVMPDHVHLLLSPLEESPGQYIQLGDIARGIKGVSSRRINELAGTEGTVWLDETWDRIIRNEGEFTQKLEYIIANPRTAGLEHGSPYPWCVYEQDPRWDSRDSAAILDLKHELVAEGGGGHSWHRLIVRAARKEQRQVIAARNGERPKHRLIVGATSQGTTLFTACFIKHTNTCGVGIDADPIESYRRAYLGDPNAAMGGILAVNFNVTAEFAEAVMETYQRWGKAAGAGGFFVEVWLAPSFDERAVRIIRGEEDGAPKKDWGKRVRLLAVGDMSVPPDPDEMDFKRIAGGMLMQTRDLIGLNEEQWKVVTKRQPTEAEMDDLRLAWLVCKHTKSNAITICKDGMLIGNGAGQMSRVMSCRIATWLAKENGHADALKGAAAASDAFFPFRDGPDILLDAGVTALIQPGGSKRDQDTIKACDEHGVAMIFTGTRHFRH